MSLRSTRLRTVALVAASVAVLSACTPAGGGLATTASPTPTASAEVIEAAPPGTPDPCAAIDLARVSEIVGSEMAPGVFDSSLSNDGRNRCSWRPVDENSTLPRVEVEINWGFADIAEHRELATEALGETTDVKSEIEGAMDAYFLPKRRTLAMAVDDYVVKVSYIHGASEDRAKRTVALAREVAAYLN